MFLEVGKIIELPEDETPTVATVTDLEKVKEQAFFRNAQNGDKVLIFTNAKKAFLYRPSANMIIEVGVININRDQSPLGESTPSDTEILPEEVTSPTPTLSPSPTSGF